MAKKKKIVLDIENTEIFKTIKKDLLDQLEYNGSLGAFYKDLVDDYMSMYTTKTMLIENINSKGISIRYNNGGGQKGYKKNDSVADFIKINQQMLKILNELGLSPCNAVGGDPSGDEM